MNYPPRRPKLYVMYLTCGAKISTALCTSPVSPFTTSLKFAPDLTRFSSTFTSCSLLSKVINLSLSYSLSHARLKNEARPTCRLASFSSPSSTERKSPPEATIRLPRVRHPCFKAWDLLGWVSIGFAEFSDTLSRKKTGAELTVMLPVWSCSYCSTGAFELWTSSRWGYTARDLKVSINYTKKIEDTVKTKSILYWSSCYIPD